MYLNFQIKKVENIFNIMSEVSSSYSLDLQLGKFKQKLDILFEVWKNVHQVRKHAVWTLSLCKKLRTKATF